jgi:hypothetical protein
VGTSIYEVPIGHVMVKQKSNIHNPIKGYDTFKTLKLQFFPSKHPLKGPGKKKNKNEKIFVTVFVEQ